MVDRRTEATLAVVALAGLVTFQAWLPGTAIAAGVLIGLIGLRSGLPMSLVIASAAAVGSALVHFAVAPEHFAEWWGFGLFFVLCGEVQLGWALLLGRFRNKWMLALGIGGSLALVVVWALSRTTGLPFGPEAGVPEPIGVADVVSVVLELVTAAALTSALLARNIAPIRTLLPVQVLSVTLTIGFTIWALAAVSAA